MPILDTEFMNFWKKIPLKYRFHKSFYGEYVDELTEKYNISIPVAKKQRNKLKKQMKYFLLKCNLYGYFKRKRTPSLKEQLEKGTNISTRYKKIWTDIPSNVRYLNGVECLVYIRNIK